MAKGNLARLTALAVATGTLVAVGTTPASAAVDTDRVFTAATTGAVLRVSINLPAGIPGVLPQNITQDIVLADGAARTGDAAAAVGNAFLGQNGNVDLLQGLLKGAHQATLENAGTPFELLSVPENPLGLTGGVLRAKSTVANPNVDGIVSSSASSIADLELKGSGALGAVLAPIEAVLAQALGATAAAPAAGSTVAAPVAGVTQTVEGVLGTALDALDAVTNNTSAPVSDTTKAAVETLTSSINALLTDLNLQVLNISASDTLLDVGLVESSQSVVRKGDVVTSQVNNKLVGIDLLGGLIKVDGIDSVALASLGGAEPVANADASILKAQVGDLLTLELADTLRAQLGGTVGSAVPASVVNTVNDALAQVTTLLAATLGLQPPAQSQSVERKSADEAFASASAAVLTINPPLLNLSAPLLQIGFVPAEASVKAQAVTSTPITPTTVPVSLPRTGGEEALAALAITMIGGALVLRRRRATV